MMSWLRSWRSDPFLVRALGPAALVLSVAFLLLVFSAWWAGHRSDALALERQRAVVDRAVAVQCDELRREQASVALWDDAVQRLANPTPRDLQWANDNIGLWLNATFGHDEVYLLSPSGQPIYAMRDGHRSAPTGLEIAQPQVSRLAARMRVARSDQVADLVMIDGRPVFVGVSRILPLTQAVARPARGREAMLVSVVRIEGGFERKLAHRSLLEQAHFAATDATRRGEAAAPLRDSAGAAIGYIIWSPDLPGASIIRSLLPLSLMAWAIILGAVFHALRYVRRASTRLRASEAHAQRLAYHDTLTGLPNRALFQERLDQGIAAAQNGGQTMALLYLDLDRFKAVNDRLGHAAGDILIQAFAKRVQALLRQTDTLARFGGDEFAIIQSGVNHAADVEALCARIQLAVSQPFSILGAQASVGVSIGIALAPAHAGNRVELARKADIALYRSKDLGRDRTSIFDEAMDESVQHRGQIEADLRAALASGQDLDVHYQPLYSDCGRRLSGFEALVRWRHPSRGMISPAEFIPIAEDSGLIGRLGEWVLARACEVSARRPDVVMSVNVSALQLGAPDAAERLLAIIAESGATASRLELELTETAFLDELATISGAIATLRAAGVRVALDDFGTGYSSLTHLQNFSVDKIKIDGSFIRDLDTNGDALAIVEALIRLGHALNIRVTAEGVETLGQMRKLAELGCLEMQGYLFSAAVPAAGLPSASDLDDDHLRIAS